jgi:(p)ppGpp synthase/HD superfamily hydrolase
MTPEQVAIEVAEMKRRLAAQKKRYSVKLLEAKPKVKAALAFARLYHEGQKRKYDGAPYIDHPIEVANILIEHKITDERTLTVALLHDVMEDCGVSFQQIKETFGETVALDVKALTTPPKERGTRAARKAQASSNVINRGPTAMMVKIADIISNISDVALYDPSFASFYLEEKKMALRRFAESSAGRTNTNVRSLLNKAYDVHGEALNQLALTVLAEENQRIADVAEVEALVAHVAHQAQIDDLAELAIF